MAHHLGYTKHDPVGRGSPNIRNGSTLKTVRTEIGEFAIDVPRDRLGTFEPQIVPKHHQRRLAGFDAAVISLFAKGMTTGDIAEHLADVYDTEISRDLVSRVTRRAGSRPLRPSRQDLLLGAEPLHGDRSTSFDVVGLRQFHGAMRGNDLSVKGGRAKSRGKVHRGPDSHVLHARARAERANGHPPAGHANAQAKVVGTRRPAGNQNRR